MATTEELLAAAKTRAYNQVYSGNGITAPFRRSTDKPLDITLAWSSETDMVAYCMNNERNDMCPYDGQIVSANGKVFVLRKVASYPATYNWNTIDLTSGRSVLQTITINSAADWGEGKADRDHFLPVAQEFDFPDSNDGRRLTVGELVVDKDASTESATGNATVEGTLVVGNPSGNHSTVTDSSITSSSASIGGVSIANNKITASEAEIGGMSIGADGLNTDSINAKSVTITKDGSPVAFFGSNVSGSVLQVGSIETDKIIAKMTEARKTIYVGGRQVITKGSGCKILSVADEDTINHWYVCTLQLDTNDGVIVNPFVVGDFVICQSFSSSTSSSRAYWRKVMAVGTDTVSLSSSNGNSSLVSPVMKDVPLAGDTICQLGHDGAAANADRTYAIVLSAVDSSELPGVAAPYMACWTGITSPAWPASPSHLFSRNKNLLTGDFYSTTGDSINSALSTATSNISSLGADLQKVMAQTDQSYMIWFSDSAPTLLNYPCTQFTDGNSEHLEDICYCTNEDDDDYGNAWRFRYDATKGYHWEVIQDAAILDALSKARSAQSTASSASSAAAAAQSTADSAASSASAAKSAADAAASMAASLETVVQAHSGNFSVLAGYFVDGEWAGTGTSFCLTEQFASLFSSATTSADGVLKQWASGFQTTSDTASMFASVKDASGKVTAASIVAAINQNGDTPVTNVSVSADKITLNGYVSGGSDPDSAPWSVDNDGVATFYQGHIGGWLINADSIVSESDEFVCFSSGGSIFAAAGDYTSPDNYADYPKPWALYYDGSGHLANNNIEWDSDGNVTIGAKKSGTTLSVSGTITSGDGSIGGWTISPTKISKGNVALGDDGSICNRVEITEDDGVTKRTVTRWSLGNDGAGSLATGHISWNTSGDLSVEAQLRASSMYMNMLDLSIWSSAHGSATDFVVSNALSSACVFTKVNGMTIYLPKASLFPGLQLTFVGEKRFSTDGSQFPMAHVKTIEGDAIYVIDRTKITWKEDADAVASAFSYGGTNKISFSQGIARLFSDGTDWVLEIAPIACVAASKSSTPVS